MPTKIQLLRSISAIGMAIATVATTIITVQANPSIPTSGNTTSIRQSIDTRTSKPRLNGTKSVASEPPVDTVSGTAETELVEHLVAQNVKFYGAYWCNHCQKQKSLFGATAAARLLYPTQPIP